MQELITAACEVEAFITGHGWLHCYIGGVAVLRWGEIRLTQDVDVTLFTGFEREDEIIEHFVTAFTSRLSDAVAFARKSRVLLLLSSKGIPFDVSLGGLPFEERMMRRSSRFEFLPAQFLRTCSAEDLVVLKAFAGREKDWLDVRGVLIKQRDILDWNVILDELEPLTEWKEDPSILPRLQQMRESLS